MTWSRRAMRLDTAGGFNVHVDARMRAVTWSAQFGRLHLVVALDRLLDDRGDLLLVSPENS